MNAGAVTAIESARKNLSELEALLHESAAYFNRVLQSHADIGASVTTQADSLALQLEHLRKQHEAVLRGRA